MTNAFKNFMKGAGKVIALYPNQTRSFEQKKVSAQVGDPARHFYAVEKSLRRVVE